MTGCPSNNDILLFAVPVCAPYMAMTQYKCVTSYVTSCVTSHVTGRVAIHVTGCVVIHVTGCVTSHVTGCVTSCHWLHSLLGIK